MDLGIFRNAHGSVPWQLVERAGKHWEASRQAAAQADLPGNKPRAFSIAMEREAGTQGTQVANEIGRLLGWHVYDHELLEHIAREMGLRTALLESLDERKQSFLRETIESIASISGESDHVRFVSESQYVHHLMQTVLALGMHGECVIVGRGAAFILPTASTLRVRLVRPLPERVILMSKLFAVTEREAAQRVRTLDHERTDFVRDHFLKDPSAALNYDLVLNTSRLTAVQTAEIVVEMLHRLQTNSTADR